MGTLTLGAQLLSFVVSLTKIQAPKQTIWNRAPRKSSTFTMVAVMSSTPKLIAEFMVPIW